MKGAPVLNQAESTLITCRRVWSELANYLENDVPPELRARIEFHMKGCGSCKAVYNDMQEVILLVATAEIIELPEGFSRRLCARMTSVL